MYHKDIAETAAAEVERLEKRRAELLRELAAAEEAAAIELEKVRPEAEALLARLQLRAEIAKEILAERQVERQQTIVAARSVIDALGVGSAPSWSGSDVGSDG